MIVCSNCGTRNPDNEEFCGKCGAFLAWDGTREESEGGGSGAGEPDSGAGSGTSGGAGSGVSGGAAARTSGETGGAGSAGAGSGGIGSGGIGSGGAGTGGTGTALVEGESGRSRAGSSQVTDPDPVDARTAGSARSAAAAGLAGSVAAAGSAGPAGSAGSAGSVADAVAERAGGSSGEVAAVAGPQQPAARQPGEAGVRRPIRPIDEPRPQQVTGERLCPKCGCGNDSTRRFCGQCGSSLQVVVEEEQLPWWRRLLNRLTQRRRRDRRSTGVARRIIKITAFLCVLAILAVVGPPLVSRAITAIRDRIQQSDPIRPVGVTASSSTGPDTAPDRIVDGANNRFWAPRGKAVDAWVEASFAEPVRLTDILIHSGISTNQEKFLTVGRPHELALIATTDGGDPVEQVLALQDRPGEQKFTFRASNVTRIRLVIRSTFGPESNPAVALAEVEFFGRT